MADENKKVEVSKEEKEPSPFDYVHERYKDAVNEVVDSDVTSREFLVAIKNSPDQEITQISRTETKKYDMIWIKNFQNAIPALENISKDPKKHIRLERYITPIELAKKITNESVMHLASHTQYIKDVDKYGNVMPNKILTVMAEDEYGIYENRFIKTLIERALNFINKRYDYIMKHADTRDSDCVVVKNKIKVGEVTYDYESKVKISIPSRDEGYRDENARILKEIVMLRKRLNYLSQSWFMEQLKNCKPVNSPIMLTNIIVKNPNYKKAHMLWKFIEQYDKLGISIHVKEANAKFDDSYIDELQNNMFGNILSLQTNKTRMIDLAKVKAYKIKPKIGGKLIDKDFLDSKFDIEGRYTGKLIPMDSGASSKERALRKKREALRNAKMRTLALKRMEREKARAIAKQKEEERIAKMREEQRIAEEKARIAREKAEAKRLEEERIAQEKAREKAMLDAEREALIRARENSKHQAEEDRLAELRILRPNGLTPEEEEEQRMLEEALELMKQEEQARIERMEAIKVREEERKRQIEEKIAQREQARLDRERKHQEMLLEEERRRQNRFREQLLRKAQAKLRAIKMAENAYKVNAGLEDDIEDQEDDFILADDDDFVVDEEAIKEDIEETEEEPITSSLNEEDDDEGIIKEVEEPINHAPTSKDKRASGPSTLEEEEEEYDDDDDFDFAYADDITQD